MNQAQKISAKNLAPQGQAAVLQVASQLLMRGHVPCLRLDVNAAVDAIADTEIETAVKKF